MPRGSGKLHQRGESQRMIDFIDWRKFDYDSATVQLWVFKNSTTPAKFRAWHVRTDNEIEDLFRKTIKSETTRITEIIAYSPISQNNENSCLQHALKESEGLIALLDRVDAPETENTDAQLKHLRGAAGYLVKFQKGNDTVYAIRKTSQTWRPQLRNSMINAFFQNGELSIAPNESFTFDSYFDFYCFNETIFLTSKRVYESITSDKTSYQKSFDDLVIAPEFIKIFSSLDPLKRYVGNNTIQLRRMTVIQQKALYLRHDFSTKLQEVNVARNWGLNFDDNGKIIVCDQTARLVMQVLLDHRLLSEITDTVYDVPDAEAIKPGI